MTKFVSLKLPNGNWPGKVDVISSLDYRVAKEPHLTVRLVLRNMGNSNVLASL